MNHSEPPVHLEPSPDDDGRLEQRLRESSQPYIDDAGFTARIIGALPPSRIRAERRRSVLLLGAAGGAWAQSGVLAAESSLTDTQAATTQLQQQKAKFAEAGKAAGAVYREFHDKLTALLTPEQKQKLESRQKEHHGDGKSRP